MTERNHQNDCILCGYAGEHRFIVNGFLSGTYPQKIYQCPRCKLGYAVPQPTRDELNTLYSDEYFLSESLHSGYADYVKSRSKHYGEGRIFINNLKGRHPTGKLLEVGCAAGYFLEGVYSAGGWDVTGIELSQWAAEQANNIPGLHIIQGTIEETDLPPDTFDIIVIRDLLEHTINPVNFLRECRRLLKQGGIIYIKLPSGRCNIQPFVTSSKKYKQPANISQAHLFYFEPRTVRLLMKHCGFTITRFYAVGLKRGLRALGIIPVFKLKDPTIPIEIHNQIAELHSKNHIKIPDNYQSSPVKESSDYRRSDLYHRYRYFVKNSLRVPLALGHTFILWAEKK